MITDLSMQNPSYPSVGSLAYSSPQGFLGPGFQKLGAAQRQRLNRQYDGLMSQVGQRAVNSGLYNTTVPMTEQQAVERGRGQAMTSLDNQLMAEQLGAYSSLTSDALAAELQQRMRSTSERDRLTAEAISNAMGLGLSKIGFVEDREDIAEPVDYDLFYQLGKASYPSASTGASSSSPSASSKKKVDDEPRSQTGSPGGYFPGVSFGSSGFGAFGNGTSGQGIPAGSIGSSAAGSGSGGSGTGTGGSASSPVGGGGGGLNVTSPGGYPSAGSSGGGDVGNARFGPLETEGQLAQAQAELAALNQNQKVTAGDIQNALNDLNIYNYGEINPDDWEAEKVNGKIVLKAADGSDLTKEKHALRQDFLTYKNLIDRYNSGEGYAVKNLIRDFDTESLRAAGYVLPKKKPPIPFWQKQGFSSPNAYYRYHEDQD